MLTCQNEELPSFALFEMTPIFVCIADKAGFFKKINPAFIKKLGYTKKELLTSPINSFIYPDDKEHTATRRTEMLNGKVLINFENRYVTKSGTIIWLDWTSVYLADKELVFAMAKDISIRKTAEKKTEDESEKYKNLASHFKTKIEKDRKYFAVELHEQLAQLAVIIKKDIESVNDNLIDAIAPVKERIEHSLVISELLIKTIKRIAFNVSPYTMDDLGLRETLFWFCKEFSILSKIPCVFEGEFDEARLTSEIKIDFFRICQESLSNIMQHANANSVTVSLMEIENNVCLSISDDGKGFNLKDQKETPGIATMKGITTSIDGELFIHSKSAKGTTVKVSVAARQKSSIQE